MPVKKTRGNRNRNVAPILHSNSTITEQSPGAAELRVFRQSYLDSYEAIMITDAQGMILDVNPAFESLYGFSRDEVVGHSPRLLRHDSACPEIFQEMWDAVTNPEKGYWRGEIWDRHKTGNAFPVLQSIKQVNRIMHAPSVAAG